MEARCFDSSFLRTGKNIMALKVLFTDFIFLSLRKSSNSNSVARHTKNTTST